MATSQQWKDGQWLQIVDDLLAGDCKKQQTARIRLWSEVVDYVEHRARLKIGPLSDDDDVRSEIADRVMKKLEANAYAHLRDWRDRQRSERDHASWWAFIRMITTHRAIEYCRTCSLNIARRGEPFQWVRIDAVDPTVFDETASAEFLTHRTEEALYDHVAEFQNNHASDSAESRPVPPVPSARPSRKRS